MKKEFNFKDSLKSNIKITDECTICGERDTINSKYSDVCDECQTSMVKKLNLILSK